MLIEDLWVFFLFKINLGLELDVIFFILLNVLIVILFKIIVRVFLLGFKIIFLIFLLYWVCFVLRYVIFWGIFIFLLGFKFDKLNFVIKLLREFIYNRVVFLFIIIFEEKFLIFEV